MGGERSMGGKGAHLGDLGWPAGRGSSRGRAGRRRRVDDEQDRRRASRGRAWTSRGGAEEEQDRRGGGRPAGWTSPGEEDRRRGRPNLTRGRANGAALPSNPPAPGSHGRARAWPLGNSSRTLIWCQIGAALELVRLCVVSTPA